MSVKLETGLDYPDGIRYRARDYARERGGCEVNIRILASFVESVCDDMFSIAIGEKIDRAGWDDTNECWSETFEERSG